MPGTLLKTFEVFPHTEAIKNLEAEIATEEKLMRNSRDSWREHSMECARAMRAIKSIEHAMENNSYWDYAKVAGGDNVVQIDIVATNTKTQITYTDNGLGVESNIRAKIFDPFVTSKRGQGASGLGMHLVYNLVTQALAGEIVLDTEYQSGARFIITLF